LQRLTAAPARRETQQPGTKSAGLLCVKFAKEGRLNGRKNRKKKMLPQSLRFFPRVSRGVGEQARVFVLPNVKS